jgi:phosphoribosylanthranilate isomerase
MGDTRVKLCGIGREADRDAAVRAGADALGFIVDVHVDTPREVTVERAADLVDGTPPFVTAVLVTMPESVEEAVSLYKAVGADALQVHGTLAPDELGALRERVAGDLIAAVDVHDEQVTAYAARADLLLVDSTDDSGAGGTGETHDWERTRSLVRELETPVALAGGLTPANVGEAVRAVEPFAVDTASGVEREGGVKDHGAMEAFVAGVRGAEGSA